MIDPVLLGSGVLLWPGDCEETLRGLPDDSVHSIVTDPPYHLTSIVKRFGGVDPASNMSRPEGHSLDGVLSGAHRRLAGGFMGKLWDGGDIAQRATFWAEALRVLKPGGHCAAFSSTRTYHRMAVAMEDAGFEVRDQLAWVYGSGFPKSLDVSKGIDRAGGISPRDQSALLLQKRTASGMDRESVARFVGCTVSSVRDWEEGRSRAEGRALEWITPSVRYRKKLADLLGYSSDERRRVGIGQDRRGDGSVYALGMSGAKTAGGNTPEAAAWEGWGTALKPAWEPIALCRKPLAEGTVAGNVLAHGCGGINVDACRVGDFDPDVFKAFLHATLNAEEGVSTLAITSGETSSPKGRWPANLVHDGSDEACSGFPAVAGSNSRVAGPRKSRGIFGSSPCEEANWIRAGGHDTRANGGSAARFFYCAKAGKADRAGSKHPTVKPVALMRWLVRMLTPPGGICLDPFAGSGTTGVACEAEGVRAYLCERETEYLADIASRFL